MIDQADELDEDDMSPQWRADCERWRGRVLIGRYAHWCPEWDELPIDETTPEWPCACAVGRPHRKA